MKSMQTIERQQMGAFTIETLADNDISRVLKALTMSGEGHIIAKHENGINQLTAAFDKLSNY